MSSLAEEGKRAGVTDKRRISSMAAECKWVGVTGTLLGLGTNVQKRSIPPPPPSRPFGHVDRQSHSAHGITPSLARTTG